MKTILTILLLCLGSLASAAEYVVYYIGTPAATLYAYPAQQSLGDYATHRVAMTEGTGDDTGRYWATLDSDDGMLWFLFSGGTQPTDWDDALSAVSLTEASLPASIAAIDTKLGTPAGASVSVDIAANASSLATIDTKVDDLPTTAEVSTDAEIADAVWDEATAGHVTAGTYGLSVSTSGTSIANIYTGWEADDSVYRLTQNALTNAADVEMTLTGTARDLIASAVWTETTRVLTAPTNITAGIADAVWDEATSGHATAGTFGVAATDILADTTVIGTPAGASVSADIAAGFANVGDFLQGFSGDGSPGDGVRVARILDDATAATNLRNAFNGTGYAHTNNSYTGVILEADQSQLTAIGAFDVTTNDITATVSGTLDANIVSADTDALTADDFAADVVFGMTATEVRTALGMAAANLDTQLSNSNTMLSNIVTAYESDGENYRLTEDALVAASFDDAAVIDAIANVPTVAEFNARTLVAANYATAANLSTTDGKVSNILTAFELDGAEYRLTTNALEQGVAVALDSEDITAIGAAAASGIDNEAIATAVWADTTRTLTAGTNIVLAKGVGITGFNDLSQSGVRVAVGLNAANLDTQLAAIDTTATAIETTIGVDGAGLTAITFDDSGILTAIADIPTLSELQTELAGLGIESSAYTKDSVGPRRTWNFTRNTERVTSPNTITEAAGFNGEVCFDLGNVLNSGAGILSITSVTASPSGPTIGTPAKTSDNQKAIVNISGHTAGTTYTYTITVSTTDGDTALVRKGVFVAE